MPSLAGFTIDDLESLSRTLRSIGDDANGIADAAARVVGHLVDELRLPDGAPSCAAALVHMTHPFAALPDSLQDEGRRVDPEVTPDATCLVLLAPAARDAEGDGPEPVVPLTRRAFRARPIFDAVLEQMGLSRELVTQPAMLLESGVHRREMEAFLASDLAPGELFAARGCDLAADPGIRSMITFGGGLPTGDLFFVSLLGTEVVGDRATYLLRTLAPAIKATLIPHALHPWRVG